MKRMFKILCINLVCIFSLIATFGCSCSRVMNVYYEINISNENGEENTSNLSITTIITKKFRAPVNTPCYKKVGDSYELIKDAEGISECYDENGNYFERATYALAEKVELDKEFPVTTRNNLKTYTSSKYEMPKEEKHSLIYEFKIKNHGTESIFIKEFGIQEIVNGILKEESMSKVVVTMPMSNLIVENENEYFKIDSDKEIVIKVEVKGLKVKDSSNKKTKDLKLNLPIVIK